MERTSVTFSVSCMLISVTVITERRTPGGEEARKKEEEEAAGETLAGRTLTAVSAKIAVVNAVILSAVTETAEMIVNKDPHPEMMMVSRA